MGGVFFIFYNLINRGGKSTKKDGNSVTIPNIIIQTNKNHPEYDIFARRTEIIEQIYS